MQRRKAEPSNKGRLVTPEGIRHRAGFVEGQKATVPVKGYRIGSIVFEAGIVEEMTPVRHLIDEVIEAVRAEGDRFGFPIRRVYIHRFVSQEIPGYKELVITFFSDAERSKVVDFFAVLAECAGDWSHRQSGTANQDFADQLAVEVMPLEFWSDVRP